MSTRDARRFGRGKAIAYLGFAFGFILSVLANELHALSHHSSHDIPWSGMVLALVWPTIVALGVEILVQVRWPAGTFRQVVFVGTGAATLGCFFISYSDIHALMVSTGTYGGVECWVGPAVLDLIMSISALGVLVESGHRIAVVEADADAKRAHKVPLAKNAHAVGIVARGVGKGLSIDDIAKKAGYRPETVQKYLAAQAA